jgi:hypothetical protein
MSISYNSNFFDCLKQLAKSVNHFSIISDGDSKDYVSVYSKKLSEAACFSVRSPKEYFDFMDATDCVNIYEYTTFHNLLCLAGPESVIKIDDPDILNFRVII